MSTDNKNVEQKYQEVYQQYVKSDEETKFTKADVKQIIEAHKYQEFMEHYNQQQKAKPKRRNIIISAGAVGKNMFSLQFLSHFLITYLFYVGALICAVSLLFPDVLENRFSVFGIGLALVVIDKSLKPFVFFFDLVSLTVHRIGLFTLTIFTAVLYVLSNLFSQQGKELTPGNAVLSAVIILVLMALVDYLDRRSALKTHIMNQNLTKVGSDHNE